MFNSEFDIPLQKGVLNTLFHLRGFIYKSSYLGILGLLRLLGQVATQFFFVYMFIHDMDFVNN